jgi:hypothetical protein
MVGEWPKSAFFMVELTRWAITGKQPFKREQKAGFVIIK